MQDKLPHIDRKFTDRAWGEMRQMLDREMPTERRRRVFFWWWLVPVGLVLGFAAWGFLKNNNSKPAAPPAVAPTQPIADKPSLMPADANSTASSESTIHQESPGNISQATNPKTPGTFQQTTEKKMAAPSFRDKQFPKETTASHVSNLSDAKIPSGNDLPRNIGDKEVGIAKVESSNISEMPAQRQMDLPVKLPQNAWAELSHSAKTPSLLLPDFQQNRLPTTPAALELPVKKAETNPSSLAFYAGGMAAGGSPANGLAMGSMAIIPLKNSKLSLEGGLGYALVQQPLSVQVNLDAQLGTADNEDELLYSIRTNFGSKSAPENAYSSTNYSTGLQLHYLQTPLLVNYALGTKISVQGGAVVGLLINTAKGFDQQIQLDAGGNDPIVNEADSSVKIPLSRFDLAATGGLSWKFLPALALDFKYQFGMKDLLKSNGIGDYNRLFQLSLRYEVKSKKAKGKS
ncbi:MAG: outer membrane beta-barrel protein [Bacteroidota bacterium]